MKKLLLLLLLAVVSVNLCAAPKLHRRPPRRIRRIHPVKVCRKPKIQYPPWKVVAAAGAAAGVVIASYKVSNGAEVTKMLCKSRDEMSRIKAALKHFIQQ